MDSSVAIISLNIGMPKVLEYGESQEVRTGISKTAIEETFLSRNGFQGDGVANTKFHGGTERAVCIYPFEHYILWEKKWNVKLPLPAFGENLTVTNMLESNVHIGDIYQLGETVVQVTQGRIPCNTINKHTGVDQLLNQIFEKGYTGYFCKVLEEGQVTKDSKLTLLEKEENEVSILFANQVYFHRKRDIEGIKKILQVDALADVWRQQLSSRLE